MQAQKKNALDNQKQRRAIKGLEKQIRTLKVQTLHLEQTQERERKKILKLKRGNGEQEKILEREREGNTLALQQKAEENQKFQEELDILRQQMERDRKIHEEEVEEEARKLRIQQEENLTLKEELRILNMKLEKFTQFEKNIRESFHVLIEEES